MKKGIIKTISFIIVFLLALIIISRIMNKGNTDMTASMSEASMPVLYVITDNMKTNCMYGYKQDIDLAYFRDTITVVNTDRKLELFLDTYDIGIAGVSYQVRSSDGERLIEDTQISDFDKDDEGLDFEITIKDLIEEEEEYILAFTITTDSMEEITYFTRIVMTDDFNETEKLDFVNQFSQDTFDSEKVLDLKTYMESNSEGDNTTLQTVTIHSSLSQLNWGGLDVEQSSDPIIDIKEINSSTGILMIHYLVQVKDGTETKKFMVEEYFRIRYTTSRIYLLDYSRTMNQILNENGTIFTASSIELGIHDEEIQLVENESGDIFAFVSQGNLYSYNSVNSKFICVYGFYNGSDDDLRDLYQRHSIKILSIDETGNITFMVYGYHNRGNHEGELGVQICTYNSSQNTYEEDVFIPSTMPYPVLKTEIDQLSYINKNQIFYMIIQENLYAIDLTSNTVTSVASELEKETYEVSDSNKMLAYIKADTTLSTLVFMNLSTGEENELTGTSGTILFPLGFMGEDLIYGTARISDSYTDSTGQTIYPMYKITIQNEENEILKTYSEENIYITDCEMVDNMLRLSRITKNDDGTYEETTDDQIIDIQTQTELLNSVTTTQDTKFEKMTLITSYNSISVTNIKVQTPKEVLFEGGRTIYLTSESDVSDRFYVYAKGMVEGIFTDPAKAISSAEETDGTVVNDQSQYVWVKGLKSTKNQIMAFTAVQTTEEKDSLTICLEEILNFNGVIRNLSGFSESGESAVSVLTENMPDAQILDLSGCTLDQVLYYISNEYPVLAILNNKQAVLIVGYNEYNTVILDPVEGTVSKMGMADSTEFFNENGNVFITYINEEE